MEALYIDQYGHLVNNQVMERIEQELAQKYIQETDRVLELGARYGTVSCMINHKLKGKYKSLQVSVEPDDRIWEALETNKNNNNCNFNIVKGFISNKSMGLTNLQECYGGYATTSIPDPHSKIPHYTLDEIKEKYKIRKFNVLVADCEGFLEQFLDENPNIIQEIRMIIFEADYPDKCNYDKIKNILKMNGFRCEAELKNKEQNVYINDDRY
jgi:FkbM family methyltransferase